MSRKPPPARHTTPPLGGLVDRLQRHQDYIAWVGQVQPAAPIGASGVWGSACALLAAALTASGVRQLLVLCEQTARMDQLIDAWPLFSEDAIARFPAWDTDVGDRGIRGTVIPAGGYAVIVESDVPMLLADIIYEDNQWGTYIMVTTNDDALGNGLANVEDHVRIETDWPGLNGDGNQILRISWDRQDRLNDDVNEGRPLQLCDWFHWGIGRWATPGGPNFCQ